MNLFDLRVGVFHRLWFIQIKAKRKRWNNTLFCVCLLLLTCADEERDILEVKVWEAEFSALFERFVYLLPLLNLHLAHWHHLFEFFVILNAWMLMTEDSSTFVGKVLGNTAASLWCTCPPSQTSNLLMPVFPYWGLSQPNQMVHPSTRWGFREV